MFPKKVKYRKWHSNRRSVEGKKETRGTEVSFGSFGLKAIAPARIRSNQIEAARRAMARHVGKNGKMWTRIFPDKPFTMKAAETPMGKGKGDPAGYEFLVKPGRVIFEVDGVGEIQAREALRKAGTKLPVRTKIVSRQLI
ncbi:50S ribosomal protein L16, partial [Candidatus Parcubacteria bacterium]|nr:50S ribosomal protein L16 [Candidatus Parcubacteria bacterium]